MKRSKFLNITFAVSLFLTIFSCSRQPKSILIHNWDTSVKRNFLSSSFWGNRLQDWQANNGRLECFNGKDPWRTVHILTHEINNSNKRFGVEISFGLLHNEKPESEAFAGVLLGAGSLDLDYRARCLIFNRPSKNGGILAGINGNGELVIMDMENNLETIARSSASIPGFSFNSEKEYKIRIDAVSKEDYFQITVKEINSGQEITGNILAEHISGNIGLVAHRGNLPETGSFWFKNLKLSGRKIDYFPGRSLGPIISTQHTLSRQVLKMTAQLMPIGDDDPGDLIFEYRTEEDNVWTTSPPFKIDRDGYIATIKIDNWIDTKEYEYRVVYNYAGNNGKPEVARYKGTIRKNPTHKDEFIIAAFTGNNNTSWQSNAFDRTRLFFPHEDLTSKVAMHQPDFLFYSGDQLYEGSPSYPDMSGGRTSMLDYLYKWYLWCWAHRELTRSIPSVSIPDDHDVFHGNLWGASGKIPLQKPLDGVYPEHYQGGFEGHWVQDQGGYKMGPNFVNMVENTQTSNLPNPVDSQPVLNNIGVYFTDIKYGGVSMVVLEDRKFKSAPSTILTEDKIINGFSQIPDYDARKSDRKEASLLGDRQLDFINEWVHDWEDSWIKISLTQTIFANVSTYPDTFKTDAGTPRLKPLEQGVIPKDYSVAKDMDSNGWPQTGRNKALEALRKGYTFMIAGDQHLGSVVHHGIDDWEDAGISFCVPSVANVWPRRWFPPNRGLNYQAGRPDYTGQYFDGFGNRITVHAASNPYISNVYPHELHDRAPGYGIIKIQKKEQKITVECWPRHVDPSQPGAKQYPDWPLTFDLEENYGRKAIAWLPTIVTKGLENPPVIQVRDETSGEIIYSIRAKSSTFDAKVFSPGLYSISLGEPGTENWKSIENIQSINEKGSDSMSFDF